MKQIEINIGTVTSDLLLNIHIQPRSWFPGIFAYFAGNNLETFKIHAHGSKICQEILETGWEWVGFGRAWLSVSPHITLVTPDQHQADRKSLDIHDEHHIRVSEWQVIIPNFTGGGRVLLSPVYGRSWVSSVHWFVSDPAWHWPRWGLGRDQLRSPVSPGRLHM